MMSVKLRQKRIARAAISGLLAAGYSLTVHDGEEDTLVDSTERRTILDALFTTDEDYLIASKNGKREGWVRFVYGSDGWDVINDYTTNLERALKGANALAERYS